MGFLDSFGDNSEQKQAYDQVVGAPHKAPLSHELIAAAASYEAAKAYEDHEAKNGKPQNHQMAKELLAGFAGAFIDHIVESKGLDFVDKEKAKYHAKHHVDQAVEQNWTPPQ
ncbi:hypothetical protein DACRYDRAFT_25262 [Dacryopinax primogenitus]|uniref:Phosphoglycerate mutase family protein n=1 Tax=Dacryopinax primogenitus (strain DJM 731) TaxID=1858805 RepID=M5FV21_DACPD|nr:uncharacterized protein DACRYDRAFT_25262 [Dacryopinax primogenitus]EJT97141.1 hypothetical protein DACRYDRAFT_25262 [Dacryopinax primogenitus]